MPESCRTMYTCIQGTHTHHNVYIYVLTSSDSGTDFCLRLFLYMYTNMTIHVPSTTTGAVEHKVVDYVEQALTGEPNCNFVTIIYCTCCTYITGTCHAMYAHDLHLSFEKYSLTILDANSTIIIHYMHVHVHV